MHVVMVIIAFGQMNMPYDKQEGTGELHQRLFPRLWEYEAFFVSRGCCTKSAECRDVT